MDITRKSLAKAFTGFLSLIVLLIAVMGAKELLDAVGLMNGLVNLLLNGLMVGGGVAILTRFDK